MSPDRPATAARLAALIEAEGPIPVARFMAESNADYYAARDPFGAAGDFITAPEISQMFGELAGVWLADLWDRAGRPDAAYVELGPGRGTLAVDALRAMATADFAPPVHFVETSPVLRAAQAERLPAARWHDAIDSLPCDRPLLIVANEFFDALPVRQFIATFSGWRERMVRIGPEGFEPTPGLVPCDALVPERLRDAAAGGIVESSPATATIAAALARRLLRQGGAALLIDYGHHGYAAGDTLQAVHAHAYADPFARPGESDLTAHVDFDALTRAGAGGGARVHGPATQRDWLGAMGLATRAAALTRAAPAHADAITAAYRRLTHPDEMGELFKALAFVAPDWPEPAGF